MANGQGRRNGTSLKAEGLAVLLLRGSRSLWRVGLLHREDRLCGERQRRSRRSTEEVKANAPRPSFSPTLTTTTTRLV